jgi:nucleoside-diphosphate-sugar epimerase/pimeloyl-ACP methyl ester carboxylesterase
MPTDLTSMKKWERKEIAVSAGETFEYFVYPPQQKSFDRVIVYIHGLISDINWFKLPLDLPDDTGVLFLPRHHRTDVDHFEQWTENYQACFEDFKQTHQSRFYHLVAQCFGSQTGMHWATEKPENFTSLTFVCPPIELRERFGLTTTFKIAVGKKKAVQHCLLTPFSYGRLPSLIRFIDNNPTTTYEFSNSFFRETANLRRWLKKNVITFPVPTHCLFASDDQVVRHETLVLPDNMNELPDQTTFLYSDHLFERMPCCDAFWKSVFRFQMDNEVQYAVQGEIKTVLVTGATGFLGSNLVREVHSRGYHVVPFVRNPEKAERMFADLTDRIEFRKGELTDLDSIDKALEGIDVIVHTAGHVREWDEYKNFEISNVNGTKNFLMIGHEKGIKQFIHISSLGVFGDTDQDHITENNRYVLSSDNYSNSKIRAEIIVKKYCRANRIPFGIVRPGFIYGEGDNNFFPNLIRNLRSGKVKYIGSKDNIVNTVYVGNVCALVATLIGNSRSFGQTYNISDPEDTKVSEIVERVADSIGVPRPAKVIPKPIAAAAATVFEKTYRLLNIKKAPPISRKKLTFVGRSRSVDASKAYQLMGGEAVSYAEGIMRTLASLKK